MRNSASRRARRPGRTSSGRSGGARARGSRAKARRRRDAPGHDGALPRARHAHDTEGRRRARACGRRRRGAPARADARAGRRHRDRHLLLRRQGGARARGRRGARDPLRPDGLPARGAQPHRRARRRLAHDSVGRTTFEKLASLRPRGLCVLFGQSSGPVPPFELGKLNTLGSPFVTRPSLAHYTATREELEQRALESRSTTRSAGARSGRRGRRALDGHTARAVA